METIVVGIDESEGAAQALQWSVREGRFHGAEVSAVMAWGFLDQHHSVAGAPLDPAYDEDAALQALRSFLVQAVGEEAASAIRALPVCDLPARALLEAGSDADLVVVGARGLGGFRGLLLGSVSQRVLRQSATPVAIIRGEPQREAGGAARIVVGVDGSDTAHRALNWALAEARARGASIDVVHAWQPPYVGYYPGSVATFDPELFEEASARLFDVALSGHEVEELSVRRRSICGGATATLIDVAEGADLLVVGSRGAGSLRTRLLGSVALQTAQHAPCPVVVVPDPE